MIGAVESDRERELLIDRPVGGPPDFRTAPLAVLLAQAVSPGDGDLVEWGMLGLASDVEAIRQALGRRDTDIDTAIYNVHTRLLVLAELHRRTVEALTVEAEAAE